MSPLDPARPHLGVRLEMRFLASSLCVSLFHRFSSDPDLSLISLESLEYFIQLYLVNCILELLLSILSNRFRCSNESNQKAIRDRSSKVEILNIHSKKSQSQQEPVVRK